MIFWERKSKCVDGQETSEKQKKGLSASLNFMTALSLIASKWSFSPRFQNSKRL